MINSAPFLITQQVMEQADLGARRLFIWPYRGENPSMWLKKLSHFNLFPLLFPPPGPVRVTKQTECFSFCSFLQRVEALFTTCIATLHCLVESSSSGTGPPGPKILNIHALKVGLPRISSTYTHSLAKVIYIFFHIEKIWAEIKVNFKRAFCDWRSLRIS